MFDVSYYELLSRAQDELLNRQSLLTALKEDLRIRDEEISATIEPHSSLIEGAERLRNEISETYLSIYYATDLYHELAHKLSDVKLLGSFTGERLEVETWNRLYEKRFED